MLHTAMNSKVIKTIYGVILPVVVILLLLLIASFNSRSQFFGSSGADFILRFVLVVWFCGLYIRLSRISSFSNYPNIKWTKADVGPLEKYYLWGMSVCFGVMCGILTWWLIQWFLPGLSSFAYWIAAINSLIAMLPLMTHYWVLKL
jgi:hypothetical protein